MASCKKIFSIYNEREFFRIFAATKTNQQKHEKTANHNGGLADTGSNGTG